jgi:hypothetical protein
MNKKSKNKSKGKSWFKPNGKKTSLQKQNNIIGQEEWSKMYTINEMILHAREIAIPFYESLGYEIIEKSHCLFNEIQHYLMRKSLRKSEK